jgi:predicted ATPase
MRIEGLVIRNFRGIRRAEIDGLSQESLITVSGRNGSGKSLLLEAMGLLWRADRLPSGLNAQWLLGSWGDQLTIEMTLALTAEEREAMESVRENLTSPPEPPPEFVSMRLDLGRETGGGLSMDPWLNVVRHPQFGFTRSFGQIDHLPADRTTGRGEAPQVNPALFNEEQREAFRQQIVGTYSQQRQVMNIQGVAPLLATADYMDLLAARDEQPPSGDFEAITGPFFAATGKLIHRPSADPSSAYGAGIRVDTPSGMSHSLDHLSSGEQEVLNLGFFIRRLRARGGVLLIDEPELHLHPALQRSLFAQLEDVAERAQVWLVTHSPRLVTAAPLSAILHMRAPTAEDQNQIRRASAEEDRVLLLDDLGIHPVEVLQSQFVVVVEGSVDEGRLLGLLPVELAPAVVTVAGDAAAVEQVARNLSTTQEISYISIRDRDLLSDDEVAAKLASTPGLFIWPLRELESELLHPPLLAKALERAGQPLEVGEVTQRLREIADRQYDDIIAQLVEATLKARFGIEQRGTTRLERVRAFLEDQADIANQKQEAFDGVLAEVRTSLEARWETDFLQLMDGKRGLGEFTAGTPFQNTASLINAITLTLRDEPGLTPPGIAALRGRLRDLALETIREEPAAAEPPPEQVEP